jgi:hypothetical protein
MSRQQTPTKKPGRAKSGTYIPSVKGTNAAEHAKAVNALDPGRYKMVKKGKKMVPVYVAKLERTLKHQCTGTNQITGKRCGNPPLKGATVCHKHGGQLPAVKEAAAARVERANNMLLDEVIPTIERLREIRDQGEHMPSALGAATQFLNRTLGKPGESKDAKGGKKLQINIGLAFGGIPAHKKGTVTAVAALPSETAVSAEVVEDDEDDDDDYE